MDLFKPMDNLESKENSGVNPDGNTEHVHCLILGSGPAGYTAAIYAARANLKPVLYTGMQMGGQLTTTTEVDNFPGYPDGTDGTAMMADLEKQARRFGTDVRFGLATAVDFNGKVKKVTVDGKTVITADSVILATGATNTRVLVFQHVLHVMVSFTGTKWLLLLEEEIQLLRNLPTWLASVKKFI